MSVAASRHELGSPQHESRALESDDYEEEVPVSLEEEASLVKLNNINPPTFGPVIAVDLDDVLSQTNHVVAEFHNAEYGTNMDVSMFYYYYYWKNPYWGSLKETFDKVEEFYATDRIHRAPPIPGAREGVQTLRDMGFRLIIVTARMQTIAEETWEWVDNHFPGIFDSVICTSQFKDVNKEVGHEVVTKLSKAQVCMDLNAQLLIDDSSENALQCATHKPPTRVLLFGDYEWNKRISGPGDQRDDMCFDVRLKREGGREFWKEEKLNVPKGAPLWRVKDWGEVVRWVQNAKQQGQI